MTAAAAALGFLCRRHFPEAESLVEPAHRVWAAERELVDFLRAIEAEDEAQHVAQSVQRTAKVEHVLRRDACPVEEKWRAKRDSKKKRSGVGGENSDTVVSRRRDGGGDRGKSK